ncbi:MAG: diphosphomevalonate decarboxylase [Anaerolineae bacterium]|nr:diphosphomevalonate decarboxylase [Anaerolineae bacterium]
MPAVTAMAHPNLALVKYWGQRDTVRQLPLNDSISVNLSGATTTTTVQFDVALEKDEFELDGARPSAAAVARVSAHMQRIRALAGIPTYARVQSRNSFPAGIGIASSASGFAALTLAGTRAAGLALDAKALSSLARLGSGSACRSIPDGFAEWLAGTGEDSYAVQLAPPEHWDLAIVTVYFDPQPKAISSLEGHRAAPSSPFFEARLRQLGETLRTVRWAVLERDFSTLGMAVEREALSLHVIAMSSRVAGQPHLSGIYYWQPQTLALMHAVQRWRAEGLAVAFTLDAGPAVHLLVEAENRGALLEAVGGVLPALGGQVLVSAPGMGARVVDEEKGKFNAESRVF